MDTKNISLFRPVFNIEDSLYSIKKCLELGWTGYGGRSHEFEKEWNNYAGANHSLFLNSNTSGLHIALEVFKRRCGWSDDDEVISTPLTFVATNHAILYAKLKPKLVDVDSSLCLDPSKILEAVTKRTRAVIFVGLGGRIGRYHETLEICRKHGLKLLLDAAHMAGTKYSGIQVGNESDAAVFSFQSVKNLPTGDSGIVCFKDPEDDDLARKLAWMGIDKSTYARSVNKSSYLWDYDVTGLGYKYLGNDIMASIALAQLKRLDLDNERRRAIHDVYDNHLSGIKELYKPKDSINCMSSCHLYQLRLSARDELIQVLAGKGISTGVHYKSNCDYGLYSENKSNCHAASVASRELISLPIHLELSDDDLEYITKAIIRFFKY